MLGVVMRRDGTPISCEVWPGNTADVTTLTTIADALKSAPGATALVNVTSDAYTQRWILWSNTCTEVRGTAVRPN